MVRMLVVMFLLSAVYTPVFAEEAPVENAAPAVVDAGNKLCPVSGEKVGGMGEPATAEYNGKVYKLCCSMCLMDFKKDPEKFAKIAESEAVTE